MRALTLHGHGVTIGDVDAVARHAVVVHLGADARERVVAARASVERVAQSGTLIYGLTTALGANTGAPIPGAALAAYQRRAIEARAVGVGPPFPTDVVRAMLFARASGMAVGGSGVSPVVLDALLSMLNAGVHPVVPSLGSIGAADLAPLAHLALPLIGEGRAEFRGAIVDGAHAMQQAGIAAVALSGKDALALISANAATIGHAALVLCDAARALDRLNIAAALMHEGFRANWSPLDARVHAARGSRGSARVAERLRALLAGSSLQQAGAARRVQDPVSLRCVCQVHGAALDALDAATAVIERELNAAADSPLVVIAGDEMLSNGNFDTTAIALAFESVGLALAHAAASAMQRCQRLYSPAMSGLPLQLTRRGPDHSGFATIQKTLTVLVNDMRQHAQPAMLGAPPVSETIEDHAALAPQVVAKTAAMLPALDRIAAIELASAAQAIDLRELAPGSLGAGTRVAHDAVRAVVPFLDEDRPFGPDVEALAAAFARDPWRGLQ